MESDEVRIILADDHPIFLKGLEEILEGVDRFSITACCEDGKSALQHIRDERPDIAILDVSMPELTGLEIAAIIQHEGIPTRIIILTISDRTEVFNRAIDHGVSGYILKDTAVDDLVRGVRAVLRGDYFFSPALAVRAVLNDDHPDTPLSISTGLTSLTPTERKVLRFISDNKSSADIAGLMHISTRTVEKHRANIAEKLKLHGAYTLVRFALQNRHFL